MKSKGTFLIDQRPDLLYPDHGCSVSPSCFTCPLPQCRYDTRDYLRVSIRRSRNADIYKSKKEGLSIIEIAKKYQLTTRQIISILDEY